MDSSKQDTPSAVPMQNPIINNECESNGPPVSEAAMNLVQDVVSNIDPTLINIQNIIRPIPSETVGDEINRAVKNDEAVVGTLAENVNKDAVPTETAMPLEPNNTTNKNDSKLIDNLEPKTTLIENDPHALPKDVNKVESNSTTGNTNGINNQGSITEISETSLSTSAKLEKDNLASEDLKSIPLKSSNDNSNSNANLIPVSTNTIVENVSESVLNQGVDEISVIDQTDLISKVEQSEDVVILATVGESPSTSFSAANKDSNEKSKTNDVSVPSESEQITENEKCSANELDFCKKKENIEVNDDEEEAQPLLLTQEEWEKRENELLLKITELEKQKDNASVEGIRMQLKVREEENDLLKHKVRSLESELNAVLNNPDSIKNKELVADIKRQHEELIAKARAMIFDKTKMVKNQELQIEALTGQVSSLKEVVGITKDLLGIRNMEVKHLRERLDSTEEKILAERDRQKLLMQKVDTGMKKNEELRCEYTQQLSLFKELREKYEARVDDMKNENKKLADQIMAISKK